ncbi:MAG: hypothetical protein N3A64_03455, partial [Desulfobacterota bacterium]|nr:hypothetical protein [Thermodesulfobacteriota bacterium]
APGKQKELEKMFRGYPLALIGEVTEKPRLQVVGIKGRLIIDKNILELKRAWKKPFGALR